MRLDDMTGRRFGRWLVLERSPERKRWAVLWVCRCDCGTIRTVLAGNLRKGLSTSCGCRHDEVARARCSNRESHPALRHGHTWIDAATQEYTAWAGAVQRCFNPRNKAYRNYGGRGITMSGEWRDSFDTFIHDMGFKPTSAHSLDRVNNDGPYSRKNCRWATRVEQNNNQRPRRKRESV